MTYAYAKNIEAKLSDGGTKPYQMGVCCFSLGVLHGKEFGVQYLSVLVLLCVCVLVLFSTFKQLVSPDKPSYVNKVIQCLNFDIRFDVCI